MSWEGDYKEMKGERKRVRTKDGETRLRTKMEREGKEKRWWKARRFEQVVGISNFPLIWNTRILLALSLWSRRETRDSFKADFLSLYLFLKASDILVSSIHPTEGLVPPLVSLLIVDIGRIHELISQRK